MTVTSLDLLHDFTNIKLLETRTKIFVAANAIQTNKSVRS